jgi:hypothetical protein
MVDLNGFEKVNNIEYGRGSDRSRGAAAELAAEQTLVALRGY